MKATSQHDFAAALMAPTLSAPAGLRVGGAPDAGQRLAERRFAVHRNNAVVGLIDALAETFPVTLALVGTDFFRAMARERVFADPPRSPVLIDYAEGFPDFIARFAPAAGVPYLADVARIETLRVRGYHAADARPLANEAYHALAATPERLAGTRVQLHPACHWLRSDYAAFSIWQAHQGLADLSEARLDGIDVALAEDVLVTRPWLEVEVAPLASSAAAFLEALGQGRSLGAAFVAAHAVHAGVDDGELFALLIKHGLLVGLHPNPEH